MTIGQLIDYMMENELEKEINFSEYRIFGKHDFGEYVLGIEHNSLRVDNTHSFRRVVITKTLWKIYNRLEID